MPAVVARSSALSQEPLTSKRSFRIAIVSDTHGLLRPSVVKQLQGVDHIIHAGDFGTRDVLDELKAIAPVTGVRGNVDSRDWADDLPLTNVHRSGDHTFYVIHNLDELDIDPRALGISAVIYGHSHRPSIETRDSVLFLNPGSIGPRRFELPISFAMVAIDGTSVSPRLIELDA